MSLRLAPADRDRATGLVAVSRADAPRRTISATYRCAPHRWPPFSIFPFLRDQAGMNGSSRYRIQFSYTFAASNQPKSPRSSRGWVRSHIRSRNERNERKEAHIYLRCAHAMPSWITRDRTPGSSARSVGSSSCYLLLSAATPALPGDLPTTVVI